VSCVTTLRCSASIAVIVCAISLAHPLSYDAARTKSRIYSNVEYNEEGGDLLGYELEFHLNGSRVTGVLRIYEGGCGSPTPVTGMLAGSKLSLSGKNDFYGKVDISGSMSNNLVKATLHMEKAAEPETVRLKIIPKPHC
jgi:hypothetical protein